MLEPLVRKHLPRLQAVYDRFPSPARHVLTSARGWILTQLRYAPATFDTLAELRERESWTPRQIEAYQSRALQASLDHARRTVPFYSSYPQVAISRPEDLQALPVLDRDTVLENQERFLSQAVPAHQQIRASTTGTTGASLRVAYTEGLARTNWAFLLRQWCWAGIEPRGPRITLQGARVVPAHRREPPYWTYNLPERQVLMSIFHLSDGTAADYLDFLRARPGKVLEGFPSVLGILADFALQRDMEMPMRAIFTSGEPLYPSLRAKIEQVFRTRIFDSYGMTEYCGLIQQCERGKMHLAPEYGFLEILNTRGEPAKPEEEGDFVWTGLLNSAMPLVRYRIGDRGCWQTGTCPCGRAFPLVIPTITRESDLLRCSDGRVFSPRALNQILKQADGLRSCQFVHNREDHVAVRAVAAAGNRRVFDELMRIRSDLQDLLGSHIRVTAELAPAPIVRPGGKIPLIVNQVGR